MLQRLKASVLLVTLLTAVFYVMLFVFFDRAIDSWMYHHLANTFIRTVSEQISLLASSSCVNLALLCGYGYVIILDPGIREKRTKKILYILITVSVALSIGGGLKYLLGRYRPVMFFEHGQYGLHFFSTQWLINSTPSDHTIRAFSFFTGLSFLFKRYTPLFIACALAVGVSRVIVTAHYPSDVLFGAYIGIFTALWMGNYFFAEPGKEAGS